MPGYEYIRGNSPEEARKWVRGITGKIEQLTKFPKMGRLIPEIGQSRYRELLIGEYRVFHEVRDQQVLIFRIMHSKRLFL